MHHEDTEQLHEETGTGPDIGESNVCERPVASASEGEYAVDESVHPLPSYVEPYRRVIVVVIIVVFGTIISLTLLLDALS